MSDFLANIARRGAGLPVSPIRAPVMEVSESPGIGSAIDSTPEEPAVPRAPQAAGDAELELGAECPAAKAQPLRPVVAPVALPASAVESVAASIALPTPPLEMIANRASLLPEAQAMATRTERVVRVLGGESANPPTGPGGAMTAPPLSSPESPQPAGSIAAVVVSAPAPAIRPAVAELPVTMQFPRLCRAASPLEPAPTQIHVRIGRIEVRAKTPEAPPPPARPVPVAPLGFARYARQRTYRNWPL